MRRCVFQNQVLAADVGRATIWRPGVVVSVISATLTILASEARAVDYADFPPSLQTVLDQRIAAMNDAGGGVCIAGRVQFSDGVPINSGQDVQVNFTYGVDAPLRIFAGGWFVSDSVLSSYYAGPDRTVVHRAFAYDPLDVLVNLLNGQVTYIESVMQRTPAHQLVSIVGTVSDEDGNPFPGPSVVLAFPYANHGTSNRPSRDAIANAFGQFQFSNVSSANYALTAFKLGYAYHFEQFTPEPGSIDVQNRRLYPNRRIVIRYSHQTDDGSRLFAGGGVVDGRISWLNGTGGVDFSEGVVEQYEPDDLRDLELSQTQDVLEFRNFYVNGNNGSDDAGAIDFDGLAEAASTGYTSQRKPVVVGHVYVVRTYEEAQYVKFLVESDESSFRSVIAGDPDPLVFAGYGLTVDFGFSTGFSQLFVERNLLPDGSVSSRQLPYVWQLSGMNGVAFSGSMTFSYLDADLIARRVPADDIDLWRSGNGGTTWQALNAQHDPLAHTLTVTNIQSLGWFAIASPLAYYAGDMDLDDDVDLEDIAGAVNCYSGATQTVSDAACVPALTDNDARVSLTDIATITACMEGPSISPTPACND